MATELKRPLYRTRDQQLVQERIDDETIVINMETGSYYSLKGSAIDIWQQLSTGADVPTVCTMLSTRYSGDEAFIAESVEGLVQELIRENLIEVSSQPGSIDPVEIAPDVANPLSPFMAPEFEVYTDVQDLLLLDPIHDVTDSGWPLEQPGGPKEG